MYAFFSYNGDDSMDKRIFWQTLLSVIINTTIYERQKFKKLES